MAENDFEMISLLRQIRDNTAAKKSGAGGGGGGDDKDFLDLLGLDFVGDIANAPVEFYKQLGAAGREFGSILGTTAVRGADQLLKAREAAGNQLHMFGSNVAATIEQVKSAMVGASDAFTNVPYGMQINAESTAQFATDVKTAFGSEFQLTQQSIRSMGILGLTSAQSLEDFRRSTGRAGLSTAQYDRIVNRNIPGMLIFGNKLAKAAIDLDRIGISLESWRSTQQGVVSNLEGTLETVNQLNQLGANIDFGKFVEISELGTPDELFRYLDSTVPDALLRTSTSFRALTEQLPGVKTEDLLKGGVSEMSVDNLEAKLIKVQQTPDLQAELAVQAESARKQYEEENIFAKPSLIGSTIGAIIGAAVGVYIPVLGPIVGRIVGSAIGAGAGSALAGLGSLLFGDDIVGYGNRVLLSPKGSIALNNDDTFIAGTDLFPNRSSQGPDTYAVISKVDQLLTALNDARTVVNIEGRATEVPRLGLVGVYDRGTKPGGVRA